MIAALAAPAALQIGGSIIGGMMGGGKAKAAAAARKKALEELYRVEEEAGPSAFKTEDPAMRNAQAAALAQMEQVYKQGGMDPQSQAALQQAQTRTAQAEKASRDALTQNAAARGMSTSGAALAGQIANQQGAADRNSAAGTQAAADARTRALQAMSGASQMAGATRGQDYQKAGALDAIERFNAGQRLQKGGMIASTYTGQAGAYDRQAEDEDERKRAQGAGIGGVIGGVGAGQGWW